MRDDSPAVFISARTARFKAQQVMKVVKHQNVRVRAKMVRGELQGYVVTVLGDVLSNDDIANLEKPKLRAVK